MYVFPFLAGLCIGGVLAGLVIWNVLRKSTELARQERSQVQIEAARAVERSGLQAAQLESIKSSVVKFEARIAVLQQESEGCNAQRARLEEQVSRVPTLEQEVREAAAEKERLQRDLLESREQLAGAQTSASVRTGQLTNLGEEVLSLTKKNSELLSDRSRLESQITGLSTTIDAEREQNAEKIALLNQARQELTATFKNLANDILEEKSKRFTDLNRTNLAQILDPLKAKIQEFQTQVQTVYVDESKDRTALGEQVRHLMQLNQQLSDDANSLTKALKGSRKELGNWGEMILEQILESCGLQKDKQFFIRPTYTRVDGSRAQPDAVVLLPGSRSLVVDSKASLSAYYEYVRLETEQSRAQALDGHMAAVRRHVNDLSIRDYEQLPGLNSPDFVVMFVPIEPAFILAVTNDGKLWEDAWKKNILLVSPSSLLFVIRIVKNLWTQENVKNSFQQIADRGAAFYDKLVGFVDDLKAVGGAVTKAQEKYDNALAKLCDGRGNVIRQAEMLKELGVRPAKDLPADLVERSSAEPVAVEVVPNALPLETSE